MMKKENYIPKAIIVFNCSDRDINTQYIDFIKKINEFPKIENKQNHIKIVFNYIDSHAPLGNAESIKLANGVTSKNLLAYYDEINDSEMFQENNYLKLENQRLQAEINTLFNSKSWKITKPLRKIMSIFRR